MPHTRKLLIVWSAVNFNYPLLPQNVMIWSEREHNDEVLMRLDERIEIIVKRRSSMVWSSATPNITLIKRMIEGRTGRGRPRLVVIDLRMVQTSKTDNVKMETADNKYRNKTRSLDVFIGQSST